MTDAVSQESVTMTEMIDSQPAPELNDTEKLFVHVLTHLLAGIVVLALWAAADTWFVVTALGLASVLSVLTAALAGAVVSTLIHEWFHYFGAKLSGATFRIPKKPGLFVYDWDFGKSTEGQFYVMSYAGQVGSVIAIALLFWLIPMDNAGRAMLIAAAIGSFVFGASIEWPVLARTRKSHDPLAELSKIDPAVFKRSLFTGIGTALVAWWLLL